MTAGRRVPVLYLAPWVGLGGSDTGTVDWFRCLDRARFAPSLITTQPSLNERIDEVVPHAEEVWCLPDLMPGSEFPRFILDFIASRDVQLVHIMNSRLAFNLLPDMWSLPDRPATVVQLHVEEPHRFGYVRYVTTRYGTLVDAFSVSSRHLASAVAAYDIPPSRCRVIPTGVDAEETFNPDRVSPMPMAADGAAEILFCGRLVDQKDPLLMVEVADELRRRGAAFRIHCVGEGPLEAQVRDALAARRLEDRVLLHGPSREMPRWYRAADVLLMTSVFEGVPYVMYEAMAMGVPVVAPALPGNVELMGAECGLLVPDRADVGAYADRLCRLMDGPRTRTRLGAEARQRVRRHYSLVRMAQEHGALYDDLLGVRRPSPPVTPAAPPSPGALRLGGRPTRDRPLVSVIIPCYGHGRYLEGCLASIRAQTHSPVEIIVVDDGSTDPETIAVLERVAADRDVRLLRLPRNSGPSAARNAGIALSSGRYILPVDADNLLTAGAVELMVNQLQQSGETIGFIYPNREHFGNHQGYVHAPEYNLHTLLSSNFCDTCSLFDRSLFDAGVRYGEDIRLGHEDWDLVLQLAARGIHGEPASGPTLRVRRSGFSRSDLVERTEGDGEAAMRRRHPALYAGAGGIKARWSPGLSFVALDTVGTDGGARVAMMMRQTLADSELILRTDRPVEGCAAGPVLRRMDPAAAGGRAEAAREGMELARGRLVCVHEGWGAPLTEDGALLEKLARIVETDGADAVALVDAAAGGVHRLAPLEPERADGLRPHTVLWSRPQLLHLPEVEMGEHPVADIVNLIRRHTDLRWYHLPSGAVVVPTASGRPVGVRLAPEGGEPGAEIERMARLSRPLRLPGGPERESPDRGAARPWSPPRTRPLYRHLDPESGRRVVSLEVEPPDGFVLEHQLGAISEMSLPGTVRLTLGPLDCCGVLGDGDVAEPSRRILGHLEGAPLPLLDEVRLARCPGIGSVLVAGEDDPLAAAAEPGGRLGWIEPIPPRPRRPAAAIPHRHLIEALERRRQAMHDVGLGVAAAHHRLDRILSSLPARMYRRLLVLPGARWAAALLLRR